MPTKEGPNGATHRLLTAANPLAELTRSQSWSLDGLGNFISLTNNDGTPQEREHNLQNPVTEVGSVELSFDANGNMTGDEQGRTSERYYYEAYGLAVYLDGDWIELGRGGLLGFQEDEVQAAAGMNIVENPLFGAPGLIAIVDPTPISGTVDAVLTGVWEGDTIGEIAANVGLGIFPGPRVGRNAGGAGPWLGVGGGGNIPPIKSGATGGPAVGSLPQ